MSAIEQSLDRDRKFVGYVILLAFMTDIVRPWMSEMLFYTYSYMWVRI